MYVSMTCMHVCITCQSIADVYILYVRMFACIHAWIISCIFESRSHRVKYIAVIYTLVNLNKKHAFSPGSQIPFLYQLFMYPFISL